LTVFASMTSMREVDKLQVNESVDVLAPPTLAKGFEMVWVRLFGEGHTGHTAQAVGTAQWNLVDCGTEREVEAALQSLFANFELDGDEAEIRTILVNCASLLHWLFAVPVSEFRRQRQALRREVERRMRAKRLHPRCAAYLLWAKESQEFTIARAADALVSMSRALKP